jgi:hypothetical protein
VSLGAGAQRKRIRLWRLRAGLCSFGLTGKLDRISSSTRAASVGFEAHLGLRLVQTARFFSALDLVSHHAPTTNLHYLQVALSIHGDRFTAR